MRDRSLVDLRPVGVHDQSEFGRAARHSGEHLAVGDDLQGLFVVFLLVLQAPLCLTAAGLVLLPAVFLRSRFTVLYRPGDSAVVLRQTLIEAGEAVGRSSDGRVGLVLRGGAIVTSNRIRVELLHVSLLAAREFVIIFGNLVDFDVDRLRLQQRTA